MIIERALGKKKGATARLLGLGVGVGVPPDLLERIYLAVLDREVRVQVAHAVHGLRGAQRPEPPPVTRRRVTLSTAG